jgi:import inner membrane translocase subunit TIM44
MMRRSITQAAKRSRLPANSALMGVSVRDALFMPVRVSYRGNQYSRTFASTPDKNESFRDMLKKVKASAEAGVNNDSAKKEKEDSTTESSTRGEPSSNVSGGTDAKANSDETNKQETINPQEVLSSGGEKLSRAFSWLKENVQLAWADLTGESKESALRKKVYQAESFRRGGEKKEEGEEDISDEEEKQERGPGTLVLVKEQGSAWDQMRARLSESPLIREMLKRTKKISSAAAETDLGKKAVETGQNIKNKVEDIREYWETSQNPLVYKISGVWDSLTAETEEGVAIKEIQKFDPNFIKEEWSQEVRFDLVPRLIRGHLIGELKDVKPWLSEAVYQKLSSDIRAVRRC